MYYNRSHAELGEIEGKDAVNRSVVTRGFANDGSNVVSNKKVIEAILSKATTLQGRQAEGVAVMCMPQQSAT